jgi:hypothetical protein
MHRFRTRNRSILLSSLLFVGPAAVGCGYERFDLQMGSQSPAGGSGGGDSISTGGVPSGGSGQGASGGGIPISGGVAGTGATGGSSGGVGAGGATGGGAGGGAGGVTSGGVGGSDGGTSGSFGTGGGAGVGGTIANGGGPGCQGPDCCCEDVTFGCPPGIPCYCNDTSECPPDYACDPLWNQCLYACGSCTEQIPLCDAARGVCVYCLENGDCDRPGHFCVEGICVACRPDCQ